MEALRVVLLMVAAALTEAQAPVFGGQYSGDVRELTPETWCLTCAVLLIHLYGVCRVRTMVTSQVQDTAVSNFQPHLDCLGSLGYTLVSLSTHHSMTALHPVACALPSRGQAQVSLTADTMQFTPVWRSCLVCFFPYPPHHRTTWFQ